MLYSKPGQISAFSSLLPLGLLPENWACLLGNVKPKDPD